MSSKLYIIIIALLVIAGYSYKNLRNSYDLVSLKNKGKNLISTIVPIDSPKNEIKKLTTNPSQAYYYIVVDRFVDGDSSNNLDSSSSGLQGYKGGDLKGIIGQFDYIKDLGVSNIILSSIQKQVDRPFKEKIGDLEMELSGFDGNVVDDFKEIDPRFGSKDDLKQLVTLAHNNGIKVYLTFNANDVAKTSSLLSDPNYEDFFLKDSKPCEYTIPYVRNTTCTNEGYININHSSDLVINDLASFIFDFVSSTNLDGIVLDDAHLYDDRFLKLLTDKRPQGTKLIFNYQRERVEIIKEHIKNKLGTDYYSFYPFYTLRSYLVESKNNFNQINDLISFSNYFSAARNSLTNISNIRGASPYYSYDENPNYAKIAFAFNILLNSPVLISMGDEIMRESRGYPNIHPTMRFTDKSIKPNNDLHPDIEMKNFYKKLIHLKSTNPIFSQGLFEEIHNQQDFFVISKLIKKTNQKMIIVVNKNYNPKRLEINFPKKFNNQTYFDALSDKKIKVSTTGMAKISIPEETIQIYLTK